MKKLILSILVVACTIAAWAATGKSDSPLIFTSIRTNPITPIKNQSRSGTCNCGIL